MGEAPSLSKKEGSMGKMAGLLRPLRHLVSKQKRRFTKDGFDLDLAYITERIIAMGFPSEQIEGVYRNPMSEVSKFLTTRHKDHFMVYNLCSERSYDPAKLQRRVQVFPFDDHNPPPLRMMLDFCKSMEIFLEEHPANVAVIHCKAGKGRTGVMISAFMLHDRFFVNADDALAFYGFARTNDCEGVTIPSQRAYVHYYASLMKDSRLQERVRDKSVVYTLSSVRLVTLPMAFSRDKCDLFVRIRRLLPHEACWTSKPPVISDIRCVGHKQRLFRESLKQAMIHYRSRITFSTIKVDDGLLQIVFVQDGGARALA